MCSCIRNGVTDYFQPLAWFLKLMVQLTNLGEEWFQYPPVIPTLAERSTIKSISILPHMKKTKYFRALEVYLSYTFLLHGPPCLVALQPKSLHPCFAGDATSCHWNQRCQRRPKRTPIPESHGVFGFRMRCQLWWVVRSGLGRWDPFYLDILRSKQACE